jgi:hypothetical protein
MGLTPVWVDIDQAIQSNKTLLQSGNAPKWLKKETFVLDYIQRNLLLPLKLRRDKI